MNSSNLRHSPEILERAKLVRAYRGEVEEIFESYATVRLYCNGTGFRRRFPIERLQSIDAAYPLAEVTYEQYTTGPYYISVLRPTGRTFDELLAEPAPPLSEIDLDDVS